MSPEATVSDAEALLDAVPVAPATTEDRSSAIDALTAAGSGIGFDSLGRCLASTSRDVIPVRVDTGTYGGMDVFFVSASGAVGATADRIHIVDRSNCALLALVPRP